MERYIIASVACTFATKNTTGQSNTSFLRLVKKKISLGCSFFTTFYGCLNVIYLYHLLLDISILKSIYYKKIKELKPFLTQIRSTVILAEGPLLVSSRGLTKWKERFILSDKLLTVIHRCW